MVILSQHPIAHTIMPPYGTRSFDCLLHFVLAVLCGRSGREIFQDYFFFVQHISIFYSSPEALPQIQFWGQHIVPMQPLMPLIWRSFVSREGGMVKMTRMSSLFTNKCSEGCHILRTIHHSLSPTLFPITFQFQLSRKSRWYFRGSSVATGHCLILKH